MVFTVATSKANRDARKYLMVDEVDRSRLAIKKRDCTWSVFDRDEFGTPEFCNWGMLKACLAEFTGMTFFVFLGIGAIAASGGSAVFSDDSNAGQRQALGADAFMAIGFGFGIGLASMVFCTADVSGGHLNPAMTIALFIRGRISLFRLICYIPFQMAGACAGAALCKAIIPYKILNGVYGVTSPLTSVTASGVTLPGLTITYANAVVLEGIMTSALCFVVMSTTFPGTKNMVTAPLMIGLVVFSCHLGGIYFTGASLNPARSFGSAAVSIGGWQTQWIYWVGPIWGACFMAVFYDIVFANVIGIGASTSLF